MLGMLAEDPKIVDTPYDDGSRLESSAYKVHVQRSWDPLREKGPWCRT
jgi:hypothetical protein